MLAWTIWKIEHREKFDLPPLSQPIRLSTCQPLREITKWFARTDVPLLLMGNLRILRGTKLVLVSRECCPSGPKIETPADGFVAKGRTGVDLALL